jgi:hypothetical protein
MAHAGHIDYRPGAAGLQRRRGCVPGLDIVMRAQGVMTRQHCRLFGHSAGRQFVHRMVSFGFRNRVAVAVSANAGTYAMPDLATPWPFGLGGHGCRYGCLRALLGFRITVMAGTADVSNSGRFFPKGPRSMRQGATRYGRAQQVEQAFVDSKRPFFAPVRRAILVVQIAEMVPEMFGERHLGELDGDRQDDGLVDQIQPSPGSPYHCGRHRDARTEPVSRRHSRVAARREAGADDWGTPGLDKVASCKREA